MKRGLWLVTASLWIVNLLLSMIVGGLIGSGIRKLSNRFMLSVAVQQVLAIVSCLTWAFIIGVVHSAIHNRIHGISHYVAVKYRDKVHSIA